MKRNSQIIHWITVALLLCIFPVLSIDAVAGMAVSPLQQWVTVKPGKQTPFSLTVTNTDRGPETRDCIVNVSLVDFTVSPQGKLSFGADFKHSRSAVEWINFNAGEFVLEPGQSKEINAMVSAPVNADGDYWAAFMVRLVNPENHEKGVRINLQTASGVFVHVARRNYIERASIIDAYVAMPEIEQQEILTEESVWQEDVQEDENKGAFRVSAELKNDGLVAFLASGKAFLYSDSWRRSASIPLYTSRRRIFPGHSRLFTGVMSQPLPPGQYKMRVFFDLDSKYGRKVTRDMEFSVSEELSRRWVENFKDSDIQALEFEPKELSLNLTPGRFTTAQFVVANRGLSTVSIRYHLEEEELPKGWLELESDAIALGPNMRRSAVCSVRIPLDAQPGQYKGTLHMEVERSGLEVDGKSNVERHKIPVSVAVNKAVRIAAHK